MSCKKAKSRTEGKRNAFFLIHCISEFLLQVRATVGVEYMLYLWIGFLQILPELGNILPISAVIFLLCHLFVVGYLSTRLRELRLLAPQRAFSASTWQGTKEHWNARDGNFGAISIQHPCM